MVDRQIPDKRLADDEFERIVQGGGASREIEDEPELELATASIVATHFASLRQPSPGARDRIWEQTLARIDAAEHRRLIPAASPHPLLAFPRRQAIAVAAGLLLLLTAITPVGSHVVAAAQDAIAAWGWIERAETPGNDRTAEEIGVKDGPRPDGSPAVGVDAIDVPYDPDARDEVEPAAVPAGTAP